MALVIILVIVVAIPSWYGFVFVNKLINPTKTTNSQVTDELQSDIEFAKSILDDIDFDPTEIIYQDIAFLDLPVYPPAWQEFHFGNNQNLTIVGPNGDPDGDGLINKTEYLIGSDPQNPDTLCSGIVDNQECLGRNDKENFDLGISPLTGDVLTLPEKITINRQDTSVLSQIQNNFNQASKEGVDFPTLYQLSKTIDLSPQIQALEINATGETIETINNYNNLRIQTVDKFLITDDLGGISQVYASQSSLVLNQQLEGYKAIVADLTASPVPQRYVEYHRYLILLFQKITDLIQHRLSGITQTELAQEFKDTSKRIATELVWTYRNLKNFEIQ